MMADSEWRHEYLLGPLRWTPSSVTVIQLPVDRQARSVSIFLNRVSMPPSCFVSVLFSKWFVREGITYKLVGPYVRELVRVFVVVFSSHPPPTLSGVVKNIFCVCRKCASAIWYIAPILNEDWQRYHEDGDPKSLDNCFNRVFRSKCKFCFLHS